MRIDATRTSAHQSYGDGNHFMDSKAKDRLHHTASSNSSNFEQKRDPLWRGSMHDAPTTWWPEGACPERRSWCDAVRTSCESTTSRFKTTTTRRSNAYEIHGICCATTENTDSCDSQDNVRNSHHATDDDECYRQDTTSMTTPANASRHAKALPHRQSEADVLHSRASGREQNEEILP